MKQILFQNICKVFICLSDGSVLFKRVEGIFETIGAIYIHFFYRKFRVRFFFLYCFG